MRRRRKPPALQPATTPRIQGTLRVDEVLAPIHSVRLVPGGIEFQGIARGPYTATRGRVRMFTAQGEPVLDYVTGSGVIVDIPTLTADETAVLTYRLTIQHLIPGTVATYR